MTKADVTIVDAGIGNVKSVLRMLEYVDATAEIASDPADATDCRRLVLPGVGAFDAGMAALDRGWREVLDKVALERRVHEDRGDIPDDQDRRHDHGDGHDLVAEGAHLALPARQRTSSPQRGEGGRSEAKAG